MNNMVHKLTRLCAVTISIAALVLIMGVGTPSQAVAGEAEAKSLLKAMSDYMAAQKSISFGYDTSLEVVTKDQQKILLASSGTFDLSRPDKFRATRSGGFANVEMVFDGKTLTLIQKSAAGQPASETRTKLTRLE